MDNVSRIKFDLSQEIDCRNSETLKEILHQIDRSRDDSLHKQNIDKIITIYQLDDNDLEKNTARRIFINCFTRFNSKKHTRKYLCEILKKTNTFERIVEETIDEIVSDINRDNFPILHANDFMNFVYTNLQNFNNPQQFEFIINRLFPLYSLILEIFLQCLSDSNGLSEEISNLAHYVLQHELIVLSKTNSGKLEDFSIDFIRLNHQILQNPQIKFDMKSKCALILGYWLNNLPTTEKNHIKHQHFPILDVLENVEKSNENCLKLAQFELPNVFTDDKMKIVLYSTVYNTVDIEILKSSNLLIEIYRKLLNYGIRFTGYPEQIILISRNLAFLIKEFDNVDEFGRIFDETLPFIWSHLEHFIESVCHNIRQLFRNLINLSPKTYLRKLLETIETMSEFSCVRLSALKILAESESDFLLENHENLQRYLLSVMMDENMRAKAAEIYIKLLEKVTLTGEEFVRIWLRPIQQISKTATIDQYSVYQTIITESFKMKPTIFQLLFDANKIGNCVENGAYLKCVQYARNNNLIILNDDELIWRQLVPKNKLKLFMIDQNDDIRILVLETIVETHKTTEEINTWEFDYLYEFYFYNASTQIPNIRNKIGNFYKKFLNRYQLSYAAILKRSQQNQDYRRKLQIYERFLEKFTELAISYLGLDSNHPRRSLCLELLLILQKITPKECWVGLFSVRDIENLKNLVFDSYESNKIMAVKLLGSLPPELLGFCSEDTTLDYFKRCQQFVRDIRPSISLSASYMFQICLFTNYPKKIQQLSTKSTYTNLHYDILLILTEQLEQIYYETNNDLLKASQQSPLYGLLITIKLLLSQRQLDHDNHLYCGLFKQLLDLCLIIKNNVMPVVCNRSPEGNLLDDADDERDYEEIDETSIAQMILVYSWRTMKEIMLLLNEIVRQTVLLQNQFDLLHETDLYAIGDCFIDIFIQSKHRGVFEQAHIAFSTICHNFWRSSNANIRNLPLNWLNTAVSFCTGELIDERLCSTRRSAGLPFLILSVLTTEPYFTNFEKTMNRLLSVVEIPDDDNVRNRMHSLNVLRFIFINSKIGDLVTAWIDKAMVAALKGFKSTFWGIRNSSTLLFSALITRIFGVQRSHDLDNVSPKNRLTISTFHLRYPNLLKFLLKILTEEADNKQSQILHPILLILARLYPSHSDKTHEYIQEFVPQINKCLSNPVFRTRDLAARALISLVCSDGQIFQQFSAISENNNHGILLQIWHLLKTGNLIDHKFAIQFVRNFSDNLDDLIEKRSNTTLSLWMEITILLLLRTTERSQEFLNALKNIVEILTKNRQIYRLSTCQTTYEWNRCLLLLCILIKQFESTPITSQILAKEFVYCLYSNDNQLKSNCLLFLIALNQSIGNSNEHPLFYYENLEIPSIIHNFIDSCSIRDKEILLKSTEKIIKYYIKGELEILGKSQDSPQILTILLLKFYPKILQQLYKANEQQFLDLMLTICDENNEQLTCAVLTTITSFVLSSKHWKSLDLDRFICILTRLSTPAVAEFSRLTITQILTDLRPVYYAITDETILLNLANTVMVLLEDEELLIRNTIAGIVAKRNWCCMPNKAREEIMWQFCERLSLKNRIGFLLLWATRQRNLIINDISEIYERGELNQYAENYDIVRFCCKLLRQEFCNLHPLVMTTNLIETLHENDRLRDQHELIRIFERIRDLIVAKRDFSTVLSDLRRDKKSASFECFFVNLYQPFL